MPTGAPPPAAARCARCAQVNLSPDKGAVLREAYRVLAPGGEMYFSDIYTDRRLPAEVCGSLQFGPSLHLTDAACSIMFVLTVACSPGRTLIGQVPPHLQPLALCQAAPCLCFPAAAHRHRAQGAHHMHAPTRSEGIPSSFPAARRCGPTQCCWGSAWAGRSTPKISRRSAARPASRTPASSLCRRSRCVGRKKSLGGGGY